MWRETTRHARNRRIFREEFDAWLPPQVLDFHANVLNEAAARGRQPFAPGGHAVKKYDFADLRRDLTGLYPGRRTFAVCFGSPNPQYDLASNNRYIARGCDNRRFFAFRLLDPNEDPAAVGRELAAGEYLGIKPYLNYVRGKPADDVEIDDMLPPWAMEIVNQLGLIVMLHIPRKGRLADPVNQEQLVALCRRWPRAKIVLAHVGRAYCLKGVLGRLERLKRLPNLWYDLAMLNHWEVLEHLFTTVPAEKILYATDMPISLAPGKSVEINDQYSYITPVPWHLSIHDSGGRVNYTSFAYEELRAIRRAVERTRLGRRFLSGLFFDNGSGLLRSAMKSRGK
jgi:hypothetical protein